MKKLLTHPVFEAAQKVAAQMQIEAYIVGGFVRDLLLNRPSKDIDIVVAGSGIDFSKNLAKHLELKTGVKFFKNFGTAMFHYNGYDIEFVGARKESYRQDSRNPIVEDATFEEDISRRDFTINALSISLNASNYGALIDLYNGLEDLENKIIRTPLKAAITFFDDPLRMMRAVRFAAQLDFNFHPDVIEGILKNNKRIKIISQERITEEFNKIILSKKPSVGIKLLYETGLLHIIFPELVALKGVEVIKNKGHKDNFFHTLEVLDNVATVSSNLWLRWAAILHDIAKPTTKKYSDQEGWTFHSHEFVGEKMVPVIFKKFKLPLNEHMKFVQKIVRLHLRPIALTEKGITDSALRRLLFEAGNDIDDLMLLCKADITSKNEIKVKKYLSNLKTVEKNLIDIEEKDRIREFQPPVSGEEIMSVFQLNPCKEIGLIKNAIKDAILDGVIANNYEEAYNFMLDVAKKMNLYPINQ